MPVEPGVPCLPPANPLGTHRTEGDWSLHDKLSLGLALPRLVGGQAMAVAVAVVVVDVVVVVALLLLLLLRVSVGRAQALGAEGALEAGCGGGPLAHQPLHLLREEEEGVEVRGGKGEFKKQYK